MRLRPSASGVFLIVLVVAGWERPTVAQDRLNLAGIASAQSVSEAVATFDRRTAAAVEFLVNHLGQAEYGDGILARLAYTNYFKEPQQLDNGNTMNLQAFGSLLEQQVTALVGTDINEEMDLCKWLDDDLSCDITLSRRHGDYDFMLTAYTHILYRYRSILPPNVQDHLINVLLNQRGPYESTYLSYEAPTFAFGVPLPIRFPETENHILMIYTARYLANQILYERSGDSQFDNTGNGMTDWMLGHLGEFFRRDFIEYNSRPYQRLVMQALLNLHSFSTEPRVKLAAQMLLDYISAKVVVSSDGVRRPAPYRRTTHYYCPHMTEYTPQSNCGGDTGPDPQTLFYMMWSGVTEVLPGTNAHPFYASSFLWAGLHEYRLPHLIHDLFVNRSHRHFYQRIYHDGIEIYSGSSSYLLTAGGAPAGSAYFVDLPLIDPIGKRDDVGMVLPTTLMMARDGVSIMELVRFESTMTDTKHGLQRVLPNWPTVNLGVAPGFACGMAPQIPARFTSGQPCWRIVNHPDGEWTFLNKSGDCAGPSAPYGCYVAIFQGAEAVYDIDGLCELFPDLPACVERIYPPFGFLEVFDTYDHPDLSFNQFVDGVLQRNQSRTFFSNVTNSYTTTAGQVIRFVCNPESRIVSIDDVLEDHAALPRLTRGTILNSDGNGVITIDNPALGQRLRLDMHDPTNPRRLIEPIAEQEVWVDFAYDGLTELGTYLAPFNTLAEGVAVVPEGGTVKIKSGVSSETLPLQKSMVLRAVGGPVRIGP